MNTPAAPKPRTVSNNFVLHGTRLQRVYALTDHTGALRGVTSAASRDEALATLLNDPTARKPRPGWHLRPATVTWQAEGGDCTA